MTVTEVAKLCLQLIIILCYETGKKMVCRLYKAPVGEEGFPVMIGKRGGGLLSAEQSKP